MTLRYTAFTKSTLLRRYLETTEYQARAVIPVAPGNATAQLYEFLVNSSSFQNLNPAYAPNSDNAEFAIGLDLFDSGKSLQSVCDLVVQRLGLNNSDFVSTVYTNVAGLAPSPTQHAHFMSLLQGSGGGMTQAELLALAAFNGENENNINWWGCSRPASTSWAEYVAVF